MARSQRQVIRYVRGLVAVVVVSSVALSSGAVEAQMADTRIGSKAPQPNLFQSEEESSSGRDPGVLPPMFSQSAERPRPAFQSSTRTSQGAGSNRIMLGVAGALAGGLFGVAIGQAMDRNCRCSDPGMRGGMIGFHVGAAIGAVVAVRFAR